MVPLLTSIYSSVVILTVSLRHIVFSLIVNKIIILFSTFSFTCQSAHEETNTHLFPIYFNVSGSRELILSSSQGRKKGSEGNGRFEGREGGFCVLTGTSHWKCLLCELVRHLDCPGPRTRLTSLLVSLLCKDQGKSSHSADYLLALFLIHREKATSHKHVWLLAFCDAAHFCHRTTRLG